MSGPAKSASRSTRDLGSSVEEVSATIKEKIQEQKIVVKRIEEDLKSLEKQYGRMAPGQAQAEMKAEIQACKTCLDEERGALAMLEAEHEKTSAGAQRLSARLRMLINDLAQMRLNGEENTEAYRQMSAEAAELSDTIGDLRAQTRALASDDANWEGLTSGLNGLSGAVTAGTGIMSAFVGENENLSKIQTRLQAVMAVTMGMQQVFNTLNRDSAFRVITVTKAKNLWTAANTRLAVSLGISTAAATALMATLTLGLSVVITALIAAWQEWSDAQDEAAAKIQETAKAEEDARATLVKMRFELEATRESLKNFNGSREDEKKKVDELNQRYGEAFGYYNSVADWYDVLTQKSGQYIDMLFKQARMQAYVNQATEVDKKLQAHEAAKPGNNEETDVGLLGTAWEYTKGFFTGKALYAGDAIDKQNQKNWEARRKELTAERQRYLNKAEADYKDSEAIKQLFNLGGHTKTGTSKGGSKKTGGGRNTTESDRTKLTELELKARQKIEDNYVELMQDRYEKERKAATVEFEREKQRIAKEEAERTALVAKLRKAGVRVDDGREARIHQDALEQRLQAEQMYAAEVAKINQDEINAGIEQGEKEQQVIDALMDKYSDYAAKRLKIEKTYGEDVKKLQAQRTATNGAQIDAAIVEAGRVREKALRDVTHQEMDEMKRSTSVMAELFEESADKSVSEIERVLAKVKVLRQYIAAMNSGDVDVTGTAQVRNKKGKVVKTIGVKEIADMGVTPEQLKRLQESPEALKAFMEQWAKLKKETLSKNPFRALKEAIEDLLQGDDADSNREKKVRRLAETAAAAADEIGGIAGRLGAMFDEAGNESMGEAMSTVQGVMSAASNIGKGFAQGGIVGGVMAAAGEAINLVGKAMAANARHKAALKQIMEDTIAQQREYNLLLMEEALAYEQGTTNFGTDRYGKAANAVGVLRKATEDLTRAEREAGKVSIVTGHKKTGLFGWGKGKDTYSSVLHVYPELIQANGAFNISLAETILNSRKMTDESKASLQNMVHLAKKQKEAWEQVTEYMESIFGELGSQMTDALVDAFKNGTDAGKAFVSSIEKMLEKLGTDMIYSAVLQKYFSKAQAEMDRITKNERMGEVDKFTAYAKILDALVDGVAADRGKASALMEQYRKAAQGRGLNVFGADAAAQGQTGKAGAFTTMTQDQGTKLEGLFTSGLRHWASMDQEMEDAGRRLGDAVDYLTKIERNTSYCARLEEIAQDVAWVRKNGVKVR